ncbi:VWA domain-containing protein [Amycolatopsis sp. FU40]|uniref:VWA domain-containing protein n=1 Tax=Amycolatopsis sp. FU40 TaxID=2914159 RepID=UPI001F3EC73E|nr:VWA domain-containing protein [Amycolatopsis sp. FU40]UKD51089.1 VWA domain-containing protein [Amycolatopsis sp. FU40]
MTDPFDDTARDAVRRAYEADPRPEASDPAAALARFRGRLADLPADSAGQPLPAPPAETDTPAAPARRALGEQSSTVAPGTGQPPRPSASGAGIELQVEVHQNEYLPAGKDQVDAVVTVTGTGTAPPSGLGHAEVIIVDCSASMNTPPTKLAAARQAAAAAIDALTDGAAFAVIAGSDQARAAYPAAGLATADDQTRAEAKRAVQRLSASGGTAFGRWLTLADRLFADQPPGVRHAILLTDGRNDHETPAEFAAALAACEGKFTCDCRGVGTGWHVEELRMIATTLLGTLDIVADPSGLAADFQAMTAAAMGKTVADITLRLWTPPGAEVRFVKQVAPTVQDLTGRRVSSDRQHGDYPTGSWGTERREYHIRVHLRPGASGDETLAAKISMTSGNQVLGEGRLKAIWTDDAGLPAETSTYVAHYTAQAELAATIHDGLAARQNGDLDTAAAKLGRAAQLARQSGNTPAEKLLSKLVDAPESGAARIKNKIDEADAITLAARSAATSPPSQK